MSLGCEHTEFYPGTFVELALDEKWAEAQMLRRIGPEEL
jgi:hypothetical protein